MMTKAPTGTVARLKARYPNTIQTVSYEGEDGTWLYLLPGWINTNQGHHMVHEWTAKDLISEMRAIERCDCEECREMLAELKAAGIDHTDAIEVERFQRIDFGKDLDKRIKRALREEAELDAMEARLREST